METTISYEKANKVLERAKARIYEEAENGDDYATAYWAAYLDGCKAILRCCEGWNEK